jgi:hypothetical protein
MEKNFAQLKEEFKRVVGYPAERDLTFDILMKHRLENDAQRCEIAQIYIEKEFRDVLAKGLEGGTLALMKRFDDFLTWQEKAGLSQYEPDFIRKVMREKISDSFGAEFDKMQQASHPNHLYQTDHVLTAIKSPPASMRPLMPTGFRTRLLDTSLQIIQNVNVNLNRSHLNPDERSRMLGIAKKIADFGVTIDAKPAEKTETAHTPIRHRIVDDMAGRPSAGNTP